MAKISNDTYSNNNIVIDSLCQTISESVNYGYYTYRDTGYKNEIELSLNNQVVKKFTNRKNLRTFLEGMQEILTRQILGVDED